MREKPRNPVSVTKRNHLIPDGRLFGVGAATGGDRVSAEGKDGRTPAMRHLFAKRAHCKWHNIAPPERRRIGSTCARVPKVSSRNRGCPFRGYGCGGNPQEGGEIFIIKERGVFYLIWECCAPSFPSGIPPPFEKESTSAKMRD